MADTHGRRPGDLDRARTLGHEFGEQLYREPRPAKEFFQSILTRIVVEPLWHGLWPQLSFAQMDFVEDLARVRRLIDYSRDLGFAGLLVFRRVENAFGEPPLVDFLNPRTRQGLLKRAIPGDLRETLEAIGESQGVEVRNSRDALVGFMTLFTDSVNVAALAAASTGTTYVNYHVTSQNKGYQLEYYPQYNYSPIVFGSKLTYPVNDNIKTGHYHFQGVDSSNTTHTDSRVYFASKHSTSTVIKAF